MTGVLASPISFLPVDLHRWDVGPGGDVLVIPIWSDIRPLRGAAGLLDWRLCGKISQMIREGRVSGSAGEKLLLVTGRVPWRRILGIGAGPSEVFGDGACQATVECALEAARGIGAKHLAVALPGRDMDLVKPERAIRHLLESVKKSHALQGAWLHNLTVIDLPVATKVMGDVARTMALSQASGQATTADAPPGDPKTQRAEKS
jgi:hypothetical protein